MASVNVLGIFAHADTTLRAIQGLRAKGFSELKVYTPVPVEEIEEEMESVRPLSTVRLFSVRREFPTEWAKFQSQTPAANQRFGLTAMVGAAVARSSHLGV